MIERKVYPLIFTPENLYILWDKAQKHKTIFYHEHKGNFWEFIKYFVDLELGKPARAKGLFWVVDDFVGLFYANGIVIGVDASVYYVFFDGIINGRADLINAGLQYIFETFDLNRLTTEVPTYASDSTFHAVTAFGFKREGIKKEARLFDGKLFNLHQFGLLRSEFNDRLIARLHEQEKKHGV